MPLEVRELIIRVTINAPATNNHSVGHLLPIPANGSADADRQAIVADCVEQVLQIIQDKRER